MTPQPWTIRKDAKVSVEDAMIEDVYAVSVDDDIDVIVERMLDVLRRATA